MTQVSRVLRILSRPLGLWLVGLWLAVLLSACGSEGKLLQLSDSTAGAATAQATTVSDQDVSPIAPTATPVPTNSPEPEATPTQAATPSPSPEVSPTVTTGPPTATP